MFKSQILGVAADGSALLVDNTVGEIEIYKLCANESEYYHPEKDQCFPC